MCGKLLLRIVTTANIRHLNIHTSIVRTNKAFNIQIEKYASDAVINTSTCNILTTTIKNITKNTSKRKSLAIAVAVTIERLANKKQQKLKEKRKAKLGSRSNVVKWL